MENSVLFWCVYDSDPLWEQGRKNSWSDVPVCSWDGEGIKPLPVPLVLPPDNQEAVAVFLLMVFSACFGWWSNHSAVWAVNIPPDTFSFMLCVCLVSHIPTLWWRKAVKCPFTISEHSSFSQLLLSAMMAFKHVYVNDGRKSDIWRREVALVQTGCAHHVIFQVFLLTGGIPLLFVVVYDGPSLLLHVWVMIPWASEHLTRRYQHSTGEGEVIGPSLLLSDEWWGCAWGGIVCASKRLAGLPSSDDDDGSWQWCDKWRLAWLLFWQWECVVVVTFSSFSQWQHDTECPISWQWYSNFGPLSNLLCPSTLQIRQAFDLLH